MKKRFLRLLTCLLAVFAFSGCSNPESKDGSSGLNKGEQAESTLLVYTSFYPMYDFTCKIGGEKVRVINMLPSGTEPHDWEPAAADIAGLEKADVFVYNGAGMEHWAESVLNSLENTGMVVVAASKNIPLIEGEPHEHDHGKSPAGGDGGFYDPHVWLDPMNAMKEMEAIKEGLSKADPDNGEYYETNFEKFSAMLLELDNEFKETLSPLPKKEIVVAHEAFGYLCNAYGLTQVGIDGLSPDSEPDPLRMSEIIDFVRKNEVKVIFFEEMASPKVAKAIAKETGAETDVLNPFEGLSDEDKSAGGDYFSVMRNNLKALENGLK